MCVCVGGGGGGGVSGYETIRALVSRAIITSNKKHLKCNRM